MRVMVYLLVLSIFLLNAIFLLSAQSLIGLYYLLWVGGVGTYIWKNHTRIEQKLASWSISSFKKFLFLGLCMILFEETLAGICLYPAGSIVRGIFQQYALNLLALPGMVIGWYLLMRRYHYSYKELCILIGLFGLYSEKTLIKATTFPYTMGILLLLPTMATYIIILTPSVLSYREKPKKQDASRLVRYVLGLLVPIIISLPFIAALTYLRSHFPDLFPPTWAVS